MAYEHKNNTGSLFPNDRKEKETHPDWQGTIIVEGVAYWINGWTKQGQRGEFYSLAVKPKDGGKGAGKPTPQQAARRPARNDMDGDEIPFAPEWR